MFTIKLLHFFLILHFIPVLDDTGGDANVRIPWFDIPMEIYHVDAIHYMFLSFPYAWNNSNDPISNILCKLIYSYAYQVSRGRWPDGRMDEQTTYALCMFSICVFNGWSGG